MLEGHLSPKPPPDFSGSTGHSKGPISEKREISTVAIYHWQMKALSRSKGRSAVAAAAYRAGEKITDERTGLLHDYTRRSGVVMTEVILPDGGKVQRENLWNAVEQAEKRVNSTVAREIVVALPHELSQAEQKNLMVEYAQGLSQRTGWAVDVAVHAPGREGDQRNTHAHLLCSTRNVARDPSGWPVMGRKTREWDVRSSGSELVRGERAEWERAVNRALERAGKETRVDGRSYAEQGVERLPTAHVGVHANALERRGIATERGNHNRTVQAHNAQVVQLSEVREQREEEQAWRSELEEMETLPRTVLEERLARLHPGSVSLLVESDPAVMKARAAYDACREEVNGYERAIDEQAYALRKAEERWSWLKERHPAQTFLSEQGMGWNREINAALNEVDRLPGWFAETWPQAMAAQERLTKAQAQYEKAYESAVPSAQAAYEKRASRYEEASPLVLAAQRKELAVEMETLSRMPYGELHQAVDKLRYRHIEDTFRSRMPGYARTKEHLKGLEWRQRDVESAVSRSERLWGKAWAEREAWMKRHPVQGFLHGKGWREAETLKRLDGMMAWREAQFKGAAREQALYEKALNRVGKEHAGAVRAVSGWVTLAWRQEQGQYEKAAALLKQRREQEPQAHERMRERERGRGMGRGM